MPRVTAKVPYFALHDIVTLAQRHDASARFDVWESLRRAAHALASIKMDCDAEDYACMLMALEKLYNDDLAEPNNPVVMKVLEFVEPRRWHRVYELARGFVEVLGSILNLVAVSGDPELGLSLVPAGLVVDVELEADSEETLRSIARGIKGVSERAADSIVGPLEFSKYSEEFRKRFDEEISALGIASTAEPGQGEGSRRGEGSSRPPQEAP